MSDEQKEGEELNNVFSLQTGLSIEYHEIPFSRKPNDERCYHNAIEIYQGEAFLRCRKCGEPVDAMQWLIRIANQEKHNRYEMARLGEIVEKIKKEIDEKTRCKCEHCGKMTRIPH